MDQWLAILLIVLIGIFAFIAGAATQYSQVQGEKIKQENMLEKEKQKRLKIKIAEEIENMTPENMMEEGWCDGCDGNYDECKKLGRCKGELYSEQTNTCVLNDMLNKLRDKGDNNEQ